MATVDNCVKLVSILVVSFFQLSQEQFTEEGETTKVLPTGDPAQLLRTISDLTENSSELLCPGGGGEAAAAKRVVVVPAPLAASSFRAALEAKVDLIGDVLSGGEDGAQETALLQSRKELLSSVVCQTVLGSEMAEEVRVSVRTKTSSFRANCPPSSSPLLFPQTKLCCQVNSQPLLVLQENLSDSWYWQTSASHRWNASLFQATTRGKGDSILEGRWTYPYFRCHTNKWMLTYIKPLGVRVPSFGEEMSLNLFGHVSVDVDISGLDLNQCDAGALKDSSGEQTLSDAVVRFFENTHKCHRSTSSCDFRPRHGWRQGGYICVCKHGFYSTNNETFQGAFVEVAWSNKQESNRYRRYQCTRCHDACQNCTDGSPCMAEYNMPFRITLLSISVACILFTTILMALVYHYRNVKVFKMASPAFLEICLLGCIIMYLEMASIFPLLDKPSCICTKWFRHMGFCITFSSLVMKTWRVSLNYRVKSAHKIKLTDKQLLQWMTPILLIMIIYLGLWTVSDPPDGEYIKQDSSGLYFKQCEYKWWDHSLAFGELLFLLWGVKVCYGVRKAESFFDEAKCISWAVYNITVVNIIMACFHVFVFPRAGPDLKYFFGFVRTQLSTTATIGLVFGPKFVRVLKGTGNQLDNRVQDKRGMATSFSVNGIGVGATTDTLPDPTEENEELKEEIQKLAAQIEFMKIVHMEVNNRHLKPKPGGYFSAEKNREVAVSAAASGQPAGNKTPFCKMEMSEPSSSSAPPPAPPSSSSSSLSTLAAEPRRTKENV